MALSDWQQIIPRHLRVLARLRDQGRKDLFGLLGRRGVREDPEYFTDEQLLNPLLERGMIEDGSRYLGAAGPFFVRLTEFGAQCENFGMMPRAPIAPDAVARWAAEITALTAAGAASKALPRGKK